nr:MULTISPECIES: hypothetical protein [Acinetobacter]
MIAVVVLIVGGLFYFINQSNKADVERLKQAEVAHQQKLEEAQDAEDKKIEAKKHKDETDIKIKELQSKYMMDYLEAKSIIDSPEMNKDGKKFYADLASRWSDALKVAGSTSRIALSQPVKDMQQIKRDLEARKTETTCELKLKNELIKSYDFAIDGFLQFMQKNELVSDLFIKLSSDSQKNANALIDYC